MVAREDCQLMTDAEWGTPRGAGKSVVIVGAGNIGSHAVPLIARTPEIGRVTIIDRDRYDETNVRSQDIAPADVGRPKALVQARRARRINPALVVTALHAASASWPPTSCSGLWTTTRHASTSIPRPAGSP